MPLALIEVFKKFAPYIAIALAAALIWFHGYETAEQKHVEYVAKLEVQSKAKIREANARTLQVITGVESDKRKIEAQSNANRQIIETLVERNRALANDRMRVRSNSGSCPVSNNTKTTTGSDDSITGNWLFQQSVIDRLIDRHGYADEITETARACQAYVKSILENFNVAGK